MRSAVGDTALHFTAATSCFDWPLVTWLASHYCRQVLRTAVGNLFSHPSLPPAIAFGPWCTGSCIPSLPPAIVNGHGDAVLHPIVVTSYSNRQLVTWRATHRCLQVPRPGIGEAVLLPIAATSHCDRVLANVSCIPPLPPAFVIGCL